MKDNIQPCEVIESNLLDPTKPTDLKTEFAEVKKDTIKFGIHTSTTGESLYQFLDEILRP